jgi:hypothetical protein
MPADSGMTETKLAPTSEKPKPKANEVPGLITMGICKQWSNDNSSDNLHQDRTVDAMSWTILLTNAGRELLGNETEWRWVQNTQDPIKTRGQIIGTKPTSVDKINLSCIYDLVNWLWQAPAGKRMPQPLEWVPSTVMKGMRSIQRS